MWYTILQFFGLQLFAPQLGDLFSVDWWSAVDSKVAGQIKKGLNSIIILGAWTLWKHYNHCVFDGGSPSLSRVVSTFREEDHQ
jgi:hypothetical protein